MTTRTMTTSTSSRPAVAARVAVALGAAAVLTLAAPLAASAHVRVNPAQVDAGSYATLTFKVPTESATAGTVGLTVDLPTDTPFTSVTYQPLPGWSTVVTTSTLPEPVEIGGATVTEAPTEVTWTADPGTQVAPGEFQQFVISAGAVPETGSITLPAHQSYSDGTVVDWADETPASGEEPEFPAPVLYIEDAPAADGHGGHDVSGGSDTAAVAAGEGASSGGAGSASDSVAIGLGVGGLALGAVALVVSVVALTRRPRAAGATRPGTSATGERR